MSSFCKAALHALTDANDVKLVFDSISGSAAARIQQNHDLRR